MKPIIGILEWPYVDGDGEKVYEILSPIIEWVEKCGGKPIGLFPGITGDYVNKEISELNKKTLLELQELKELVKMCDGIVKVGANRIYPYENSIYEFTNKEDIPYLGICSGMNMMRNYNSESAPNVLNGDYVLHYLKDGYAHNVTIMPNTKLSSILGEEEIMVNSRHNYHIPDQGKMEIAAYAEDGVIEALEAKDKLFSIGVQWHPELLPFTDKNSTNLFGEFIESAKVYKKHKI